LRRHKETPKRIEIRISGLGGQGVVLAGQTLGRAAVYDGKNAVQTQSYGAEARGSIAKSEIIISTDKIGFPVVRKCDVLVAMNQEALEKYLKDLKKDGVLIVDSTYVKKIPQTEAKTYRIPATEEAEKAFKAKIYGNMLMLGAITKITRLISVKAMTKAIEDTLGEKNADTNKQAFKRGRELIK
jgi:2-oxoglutarate ferredoxin oxidoreductase subunit gamma